MSQAYEQKAQQAWTPSHVSYARTIAARLAVEVVTGDLHPDSREDGNPYTTAARHLGAIGVSRSEVLEDLTYLLRFHGVEPIPLVEMALSPDAEMRWSRGSLPGGW